MDKYIPYLRMAAGHGQCLKTKRGAVIIDSEGEILSIGSIRDCPRRFDECFNTKDFNCTCVHAEEDALSAVINIPPGSKMIHLKFNEEGEPVPSARRFCPKCVGLMRARGIEQLWLYHEDGWEEHNIEET